MSEATEVELIPLLRQYADVADAGGKSHWATAMRRAVGDLTAARAERDHWKAARDMALSGGEVLMRERDAARARVAELEAGLRKTAEALSAITGDFNMTRMMMNDTTTRDLAGEIVKDSRACVDAARALLSPSPETTK